jgi:succinyl-diaminopimelate desuccinylase
VTVELESGTPTGQRTSSPRERFEARVLAKRAELIELCERLVRIDSQNPPGSTQDIAAAVESVLGAMPGFEVQRIVPRQPIVNVVARRAFAAPGRRLVFNGHLDTFPAGDASSWSLPPLSGRSIDGRIYGRGASDMKGGLAVSLIAAELLSAAAEDLRGELVLTLAGDEETGGRWGTGYLLENVPFARGDAMLSADAGSPRVIRYGEKGLVWLELIATGRSNHGAHVHLGKSAADSLLNVLNEVIKLRKVSGQMPGTVERSMRQAQTVSEAVSGKGEFDTLRSVTVNIGVLESGASINIIPDRARALLDIRLPPGVTTAAVVETIEQIVARNAGVTFKVLNRFEPNVTDPNHEIVQLALGNARRRLGESQVVANMRVGMSDARLYRGFGVPSIVCGPTPYNMGGPDEYVVADELFSVLYVHAMTAYDYLTAA